MGLFTVWSCSVPWIDISPPFSTQDKLQKEERNTVVNLLKLNEGWRSILRQTRANDLRKDIGVVRQTFERQLDGLDDVIKVNLPQIQTSAVGTVFMLAQTLPVCVAEFGAGT